MREGDILVSERAEGFGLSKVLRITDFGDGSKVAHVLMYRAMPHRPTLADVGAATVFVMHAPFDARAIEAESEVIGNVPVARGELVGYLEYLKRTDFRAYVEERGISIEELAGRAKAAYDAGNALCEKKRFAEAIEKYSEAIDELPMLFEAHDNRAFAMMDLGRMEEAKEGFAESLRLQPDNPVALFSLGECHLKLEEIDDAVRIFGECVARWPDHPHHRELLARAEALRDGTTSERKPWWRFW